MHTIRNASKSVTPLNNTISAAADVSDNQLTQAVSTVSQVGQETRPIQGRYGMSDTSTAFQHQLPPSQHFQPYLQSIDSYYYHGLEYPHPNFLNSQAQLQQDYKPVPFNTFPPYSTDPKSVNSSVSLINVTSSSPTHNSGIQSSISSPSNQLIPTNQATPSPSSNQLDKCGHISETPNQLGEHYATSHGSSLQNEASRNAGVNEDNEMSSFPYNPYIKEEQPCDILDLDSQKIVYSPNDDHSQQGPLPPMHSLHHLQIPLIWQEHHALPYTQDIKPTLYPTIQPKQDFVPTMKQDYIHHQSQIGHQTPDVKQFASDVTGNQVTSSPSEFPSTTTPQENGGQFRTSFEAATSSHPTNAPTGKSSTWKSNEARRPKTYNCTACNKWFTSSGHLKRHYNTTLHKNAVKSSGQPDPAVLPISSHHHPARDQNKSNHHHRGSPAQPPAQPPLTEQSASPEYNSQYTPPMGFQQTQGFQQYGASLPIHSTTGSSPNEQAGPSVLASQTRGLQTFWNNTGTQQVLQQVEHQRIFIQRAMPSHTITSLDQFSNINHTSTRTNTNTMALYQGIQGQEELGPKYHTIIGNGIETHNVTDNLMQGMGNYTPTLDKLRSPHLNAERRLMGGVAYLGDTKPPFSPDIAETIDTKPVPEIPLKGASQPLSPTDSVPTEKTTEHRCTSCDKVFNKSCYLTQHNKTFHSGEKPYKCQKCGKRFACGPSHELHLSKHSAVKRFQCSRCVKSFNYKTDLRRHMCLHDGIKPFTCPTCGKGFIRKDHMMKHTETHTRKSANLAKKQGISKK